MKSCRSAPLKKQKGLSLIELMVAILISSILLLGVVELFLNTFRTDRTNTELSRVQESGRVAMELISREVRRAGYQGCIGASIQTTAGGITYPYDAFVGPTTTSFTVNYARETGTGAFPNRGCDNEILHPFQITFTNCGVNLCINSTDSGGINQTLTNDTQITGIQYGVLNERDARISWINPDDMGDPDVHPIPPVEPTDSDDLEDPNFNKWPYVKKVQITLAVSAPNDADFQARNFTSVIELRNRL